MRDDVRLEVTRACYELRIRMVFFGKGETESLVGGASVPMNIPGRELTLNESGLGIYQVNALQMALLSNRVVILE